MKEEKRDVAIVAACVCLCMVLSGVFIVIYRNDNLYPQEIALPENIIYDVDKFFYGYDPPIAVDNGMLYVSGWIAPKNESLEYIDRTVILIAEDSSTYAINTIACNRGLTEYFNTGYNFDLGGIQGKCYVNKFNKGDKFQIAFLATDSENNHYFFPLNIEVII